MLVHVPRVYPCPYCRSHMTTYVLRNREVDLYPLEWTLLGLSEDTVSKLD